MRHRHAMMRLTAPDGTRLNMSMLVCVTLVCLLVLLPRPARAECLANPDERSAVFKACPLDTLNYYNITMYRDVPSVTYCGKLCLSDSTCMSFNVQNDGSGNLQCQLSMREIADCSTLSYVVGARTYAVKTSGVCTEPWRMALKTYLSSVVNGSLSDLQDAALSGAQVRILREPYPQASSTFSYQGTLYAVDSLKVQDFAPYVVANVYTFFQPSMNDKPLWTHIKIDTSGDMLVSYANSSIRSYNSNSLTWLVQSVTRECYQQVALSHNGPVGRPALVVEDTERTGELSDLLLVLGRGSTARMVSHYGTAGALVYPTYFMADLDTVNSLYSISYWIPGEDPRFYLPLRVHEFNFSSVAPVFESFIEIDTTDGGFYGDFAKDPDLSKTELFVDPCWELVFSVDDSLNVLSGSWDDLVVALRAGASLLFAYSYSATHISFEAELIELGDSGYFDAYSKMGVTSDSGYTWTRLSVNQYGYILFGDEEPTTPGARNFYVAKRNRPYRLKMVDNSEIEGTWDEASQRLRAGLIPRAIIENSSASTSYILDVQTVKLAYQYWNVYFHSYRLPESSGFKVYMFALDTYMRVDIGQYRGYGSNIVESFTEFSSLTLIFEDYPVSP